MSCITFPNLRWANKQTINFKNNTTFLKLFTFVSFKIGKIGGVAIDEFVGLKTKMYSFLVDDNNKHKKARGVNRNVVATISHNKYEEALFNNKCLRHSMNRIQSKDHRPGTYEIKKIPLSYFDDKIYIQKNGYDRLALGYQS